MGPKGDTGNQGLQGVKGDQGIQGPKGDVGATGSVGATGATGDQGIQGIPGVKGDTGAKGDQGLQGPIGLTGDAGPKGDTGSQGPKGDTGNAGTNGTNGNTILSVTGVPGAGLGVNGDYAYDQAALTMYGPKAAGAWPAGKLLKGDQGIQGVKGDTGNTGAAGNTVLSVVGLPTAGQGIDGDFAYDSAFSTMYGPKAGGVWPAGKIIMGATGLQGPQGNQGPQGVIAWDSLPVGTGPLPFSSPPPGWIAADGGTIGNTGSGATRANVDCLDLFTLWWSKYTNAQVPLQDSTGAASLRGVDAASDWNANKRMVVFDVSGRFTRAAGAINSKTFVAGTKYADSIKSHTHPTATDSVGLPGGGAAYGYTYNNAGTGAPIAPGISTQGNTGGDTETAPASIAFLHYFKLTQGGPAAHAAAWLKGTGVPSAALGVDTDIYLDVATGDVYGPKSANAWGASTLNLKGPQGTASQAQDPLKLSVFSVHMAANYGIIPANAWTVVRLWTEDIDVANVFEPTTNGRFQPTNPGWYMINAGITLSGDSGSIAQAAFFKNGLIHRRLGTVAGTTIVTFGSTGSSLIYLNGTSDYVDVRVNPSATNMYVLGDASGYFSWMNGYMVVGAMNARWLTGAGVPAAGVGNDGDLYLNLTNYDIYGPKTAGAWGASVGNIKGDVGLTGPKGDPGDVLYDMASFYPGRPNSGDTVFRLITAHPYKLPVGLPATQFSAKVAATGAVQYKLQKNGADIGTINVAAGATTATYTFATETSFAAGDIVEIIAPALQDVTLASVSITLAGTRVTAP